MRVTEKMKKLLSILLCLCMLLQNAPVVAFAAGEDNLCEHHPEHTAECHYAEAVAGVECAHECGEECAEGCVHTAHDDACGYAAAVEAHECHYECAECANNELSSRTSPQTGVAIPEGDAQNQEIATSAPDGDLLAMTEAVCDCGTDDPAIHAVTCGMYVAPENPLCTCAEACGVETQNFWCDVCGFDYSKCTGTDTAAAFADGDDLAISGAWMSSSTPYLASGSKEASATQPETGYAHWDAASNTLTLNNFTSATGAMTGIFYSGAADLYIKLVGNNSVTGGNGGSTEVKSGVGVNLDTDIIFSGGGTLTATGTGTGTGNGGGYGVFAWGDITVDSGTTLIATGSSFLSGVLSEGGSITVNGGSLTGNGGESGGNGVHADSITVNGGSLTGNSSDSRGVAAYNITVENGGIMEATGKDMGVNVVGTSESGGSLTVNGDSHIVAIGGSSGNRIPVGNLPEDYYYYASGDGTDKTFTHSTDAPLTGTVTETYFELVTAQHLSDTYTSNGDATHSRYCNCALHTKVTAPEACSGGSATCTEQAKCDFCDVSYGELAPTNHASTEFTYAANEDGTTHKKMHKCCSAVAVAAENHTGGTATCKDKAVCTVCGESYGEVDTTNHDETVAFDSKGFCENGCYQPAVLNGDVYEISNAGQLFWFAQQVNGGKTTISAILTDNIVVNAGTMSETSTDARVWTPIGDYSNKYTGTFDGNGKTVSGLYFHNDSTDYVGLFGYVNGSGTVQNVGVIHSYLRGRDAVGGIAGRNDGLVTNSYNTGSVSGTGYRVGGVVGWNNSGTVTNSYNTGSVSGTGEVGGVVGYNQSGTVTNCYNTGTVSGTENVGGVVGYNRIGTVTNCYYLDTACIGGINGADAEGQAEAKTEAQFASGEVAYLLNGDQSEIVFKQTLGADTYPSFSGSQVYYGFTTCDDTAAVYTNNANVFPEKPEHTQNPTYTDNHDGTHSAVYPCCGTTVTEGHTMDTATGKCACDYQFGFYVERYIEIDGIYHETYWFDNLSDALSYAHGSTEYGQYTTQSATVRLHRDLTIEEGEIFSFQKQVVLDTNSFSVTNHGTLALEGYTYSTIPAAITGGTVKIGEKSYTWDSENNKWICAEGSHTEGTAATCVAQAICAICGESYGDFAAHTPDANGKCTVENCGYRYPAKVGDTFYESIHKALRAAEGISGCTLTLLDDIILTSSSSTASYVNKGTITLDLNGKTFSSNKGTLSVLGTVDLTIRDSIGGGKIVSTYSNAIYQTGGKVTIEGGTFEGTLDGVFLSYDSTLIVKGGTFTGGRAMITGFGSDCEIDLTAIDPAGFTLKNNGSGTFAPTLPSGYAMVNGSGTVVTSLSAEESATVKASLENATVTLDKDTFTYDGQEHKPTVTVVLGDKPLTLGVDYTVIYAQAMAVQDGKPFKWFGTGPSESECINAGSLYFAVVEGIGNYYTEDTVTLCENFVIAPRPLTVKADDQTILVGGQINEESVTVTEGSLVAGHTLTASIQLGQYTEAGSVVNQPGFHEDVLTILKLSCDIMDGEEYVTDNYSISFVSGNLTVVEHVHEWSYSADGATITAECKGTIGTCPIGKQTVTVKAEGKTYDGTPVTAELDGSIDGVTAPEITYTGNTNAGTHTASITIEGKTASVKFTIEKATVTVTADAKSKPYGTDNPTLTYTPEGLLGDDALTGALETTATKTSSVGEYDITVGSLANSNYTIDFVGAKLTITKAAAPEIQWPTAAALTYGQKLSDSALTSEDKNGTFAWQDGSIVPTVKNDGYVVVYTPKDTANYDYTGVALTKTIPVTVSKVSATVTVAPTPNTLTYTGEAQYLITAGEAEGGTMQYQLNGGVWSASIPTAKDEGTYTVSWKVVGDANHADTEVKSITVTIGDCTHSGNTNVDDTDCTTQVTCSVCGDVLVEAKAHVWGDWTITKNPTTTEEGSRERLCTNDGCEAKDTDSIPMLNEVEVPEEIVGGDIEVSNPTPATGDDVTITVTPDTGKEVDEVIVTGKDGKEIPVTDNGDGTYTYEQPDGDVTVEVVIKDTIYTVTWIVDGKTYKETQHKYGETITAPTDPIKAQSGCTTYTFDKWNGFTSGMTMPDNESLAFTAVFTEGESHIDENTDHICDRNCGKTDIEDHADPSGDNDHVCDYCRQPVNECSDVATDKDHLCDECGAAMPKDGTQVEIPADDTGTITPGAPAEIDGKPIVIDWDGEIWLEDKDSKFLVTYKFNEDADPHKEYPTAMYAWLLKWEGETCKAIRVPELDNFMTYKGTSIRVGHSSDGIRFFTAVPVDTLNQAMKGTLLTGELEGYKLVEMGTLYKWAASGTELTTDVDAKSYVYGGTAGSNYRQFSKEGSLSWFTGMLTDLPGDAATLAKDILSRPYAVFENADGDQITLYGGSIQRSIYYVALQNKDTWASGTAYDNYVEKIISTVEAAKG